MNAATVLEDEWIDADAPRPLDPLDVPKGFELIDGELVEMPVMGFKSSWVASQLHLHLGVYLLRKPIGVAATAEASYACWPDRPKHVRKPDVSVILCDPHEFVPPKVNSAIAPSLVVEVVSPNERVYELDEKVAEFLSAGTRLIWIVNPELRTVLIRRAEGSPQLLFDPSELSGEDVLPDFKVALADFLPKIPGPKTENPTA